MLRYKLKHELKHVVFLFDEGPALEMSDFAFDIGSTTTFYISAKKNYMSNTLFSSLQHPLCLDQSIQNDSIFLKLSLRLPFQFYHNIQQFKHKLNLGVSIGICEM